MMGFGVGASGTGVGALVGVPVAIGGGIVVAHGSTVSANGAINFGKTLQLAFSDANSSSTDSEQTTDNNNSSASSGSSNQIEQEVDPLQKKTFNNDINKSLQETINGRGIPRRNDQGEQKIFEAREYKNTSPKAYQKWRGAKEWDVPDTKHRILERTRPDGTKEFGVVKDHNYKTPPIPVKILQK